MSNNEKYFSLRGLILFGEIWEFENIRYSNIGKKFLIDLHDRKLRTVYQPKYSNYHFVIQNFTVYWVSSPFSVELFKSTCLHVYLLNKKEYQLLISM